MSQNGIISRSGELPDVETLRKIADAILNQNQKRPFLGQKKSYLNTVTKTAANVVEFSVPDSNESFSVVMKKVDDSTSNELQAYSTLFTDLQAISIHPMKTYSLSSLQKRTFFDLIPRAYLVQKPQLFLENLESPTNGFKRLSTGYDGIGKSSLDFNHCLLAIETLARFHASSYLLRRQLGEKGKGKMEMLKKYPFINQQQSSVYSSRQSAKLSPIFEKAFELACKLIEIENPSLAFKLQRKVLDPSGIFDKIVKLLEEEKYDNDDFYVVCHGNSTMENFLCKYDMASTDPVECRLANFSSVYMGPLASDLVIFLLCSTTLSFRQEYEEKLLAFYCDAFQEQIISSGRESEIVKEFEENIDEFHRKLEKQYKKMLEFGFYHACLLLPITAFMKYKGYNNNYENVKNATDFSLLNLLNCGSECLAEVGGNSFEKYATSNSAIGVKLVEILQQLLKNRVLL